MRFKPDIGGRGLLRGALGVLLLAAVFLLGFNVGDGRLSVNLPGMNQPVAKGLPSRLDYSSVNQIYQSLKANYDGQLSEAQLIDGLKHGLATATHDPYTVYFTPQEARDFNKELNNSFSGIGAQLGQDKDGNVEVIAPIDGLPADKAGLKAHDLITAINGTSTNDMSVDEAVHRIRGPKDTKVTLQVVRNKSQALKLTITRDNFTLPSVKTKILPGNIGYLQISTFSNDTNDLALKAAQQFQQAHVKAVILDLRDNPGGLLDSAIHVSSLWLPQGQKILDEKRGHIVMDSNASLGGDMLRGLPTVVLINGGSASASEITAGALHDDSAAYLIGEKSYGKGVVQQLVNFGDGSQLKVTIASWYRPNGQNINHRGITPDQVVKMTEADSKTGNDPQLQAAQAYLNK